MIRDAMPVNVREKFLTLAQQNEQMTVFDGNAFSGDEKAVPVKPKLKNSFKVASLFCGAGGVDLGFVGGFKHLSFYFPKLPFQVVWSNDIDTDAAASHKANGKYFKNTNFRLGDIRNISTEECPDVDVITAGFPCQPFSNAGSRKGVGDHRGTLFEEVERFIVAKNPKAFVLENVKGILSSKVGELTVPEEITRRINLATNNCYEISMPQLLKSENYGIPQRRHRVIIVGIRKDLKENIFDFQNLTSFIPQEMFVSNTVKNIILGNDSSIENEIWDLSPQQKSIVPFVNRSWKDIPYDKLPDRFKKIRDNMTKYHSPNFYRRFALNEINGTITASAQPENCGILHPTENRRYGIREIARIQTFPDDFAFEAKNIQGKYKVIGNAVPPVLAWLIAKQLLLHLEA